VAGARHLLLMNFGGKNQTLKDGILILSFKIM
jgi:hypothetical protein